MNVKSPNEVLALGQQIVAEFSERDRESVTLRWLAHHLAQLLLEAKTSTAAQDRAVDTILKIWQNRKEMPGRVYPLADYGGVLKVLDRLRPDANPWTWLQRTDEGYELAALFDSFTRIMFLGMLSTYSDYLAEDESGVARSFLDDDEREIWETVQGWKEFFAEKKRDDRQTVEVLIVDSIDDEDSSNVLAREPEPEPDKQTPAEKLQKVAHELIDEAHRSLDQFRNSIDKSFLEDESND